MRTKSIKIITAIVAAWSLLLPATSLALTNINDLDVKLAGNRENIEITGLPGSSFDETLLIHNYSAESQKLSFSAIDVTVEGQNFIPSSSHPEVDDTASWITVPTGEIIVLPGKTTEIPIQITYPERAGVGKHYAGIMTSRIIGNDQTNTLNIETGIRVYANVEGNPQSKFKLINPRLISSTTQNLYSTTIVNSGNTDLDGKVTLINQANSNLQSSEKIFLKPGEDLKLNLALPPPGFGAERLVSEIELNNQIKSFVLQEDFHLPGEIWTTIAVIMFLLTISLFLLKTFSPEKRKQGLERTVIFSFLLLCSLTVGLNLDKISAQNILADSLQQDRTDNYLTTIKWGDLQRDPSTDDSFTSWNGYFTLNNGQMYLVEKLHNEADDQINLGSENKVLFFENVSGPDNDGVILLIKTLPGGPDPTLTMHNLSTGEEIPVRLEKTLKQGRFIKYKQQEISINSEPAPALINVNDGTTTGQIPLDDFGKVLPVPETPSVISPEIVPEIVVELESTEEVNGVITDENATPDTSLTEAVVVEMPTGPVQIEETVVETAPTVKDLSGEIAMLKNLIQDIPASPDVISEYILNSEYVEAITSENLTTIVSGNSALIRALKDTPLTIQELTSTPDLNYAFIPNEKIKLAPQSFSFTEQKTAAQELNEIVFVQRKEIPWSVYMSIGNLISLSGSAAIPSDNVTIDPGAVNLVTQNGTAALIEAGIPRAVSGLSDQLLLVSIIPQGPGETTFSITPKLSITVPPRTPPGIYRAMITIRII